MKRDKIQKPKYNNNLFQTVDLNKKIKMDLERIISSLDPNYCRNKKYYNYLSKFFGVKDKYIYYNWSSDYIIKDLFSILSKKYKKIYIYDKKYNYQMINIYSKLYNFKEVSKKDATLIYLTFPNINIKKKRSLKNLKKILSKNKDKIVIIDFAYYNNYFYFKDLKKILKRFLNKNNSNLIFIFSFTKFTGNANIKQGILITKNNIVNKLNLFMNPHRINNIQKELILPLNKKDLDKHTKRLKDLKKILLKKYKKIIAFDNGFNLFFKKDPKKIRTDKIIYKNKIYYKYCIKEKDLRWLVK